MRSRRNFIGGAVGSVGLLAGCAGILGNSSSSSDEEPSLSIDIQQREQNQQYDIYASIEYNDAKGFNFEYEGGTNDQVYSPRVNENPEKRRLYEVVEGGTMIEVVAFYGDDWEDREQIGSFEVNGEQSLTI